MSIVINLNQFKKAKQAIKKKIEAVENVVKFGQPKAQKKSQQNMYDRLIKHVQEHTNK